MNYDVAIIGAGVSGACIARLLSQYHLKIALIDKAADVSFGTSKANSGIIHGGFHSDAGHYLKAKLEIKGNLMFDQLKRELDFPFVRCGILVVAFREEEVKTLEKLYRQGINNGAIGIEMCGQERTLALEPKLSHDVLASLHAPGGGIIEPYRFVFAMVESAVKNGTELLLNFEVAGASKDAGGFLIESKDRRCIRASYVINAAGVYADEVSEIFNAEKFTIIPRKGEEYLIDRFSTAIPSKVIFPVPGANSKGTLCIPTPEGTMMVGPSAVDIDDKEELSTSSEHLQNIFEFAKHMIPAISERDIITSFAGLRPALAGGDFLIENSAMVPGLIHVAGIQSPGLTASPAIAEYVKDLLKKAGCTLVEKSDFDPSLEKFPRIRSMTPYEAEGVTAEDPAFGNIVCRCEHVSEAEIVEAIRRGHTTLDGIKFFTRSGMGRCQGGFCSGKIMRILMRETGMSFDEITKRGGGSRILTGSL